MKQILKLFKKPTKIVPSIKHQSIVRSAPKKIKPDNTPLYIRRGWVQKQNRFSGYYRTMYGAWKGLIVRRGDIFEVFIYKPPVKQLENHPKWACFHKRRGRYFIHLHHNPKDRDPGSIIEYVERVLIESFRR